MSAKIKISCQDLLPYVMENRLDHLGEVWDIYCGYSEETDEISRNTFQDYGSLNYVDLCESSTDNNYFSYYFHSYDSNAVEEIKFYCYKNHFGEWVFSEAEFVYVEGVDSASEMITGKYLSIMNEMFDFFKNDQTLDNAFNEAMDGDN